MQKELNVIVAGKPGNGKTAVAELIAKTLKEHGFDVTYSNTEDRPMSDQQKNKRVEVLASVTKINVNEVQLAREPKNMMDSVVADKFVGLNTVSF